MKGMIIYQSKYGNCEQIARSLYKGLQDAGVDVAIAEVRAAQMPSADLDFIAIGSPTMAGRATGQVRKYIESLGIGTGSSPRFVAFGTGLSKWLDKGQMAADFIQTEMTQKGFQAFAEPLRLGVSGRKGPLVEGSVEKAYEYGKKIGSVT